MARNPQPARTAAQLVGLGLLGLLPATAQGQDGGPPPLPDPIAPAPFAAGPAPAAPSVTVVDPALVPPEVRPTRTPVLVPPEGIRPTYAHEPDDPVATARKHPPRFVRLKQRSILWRRVQGRFYGYPEEFVPRPLGAALADHNLAMVANGAAARLTLYDYDFVQGSSELSPRGIEQLIRLAPQLQASPYPLIIERTPANPALAQARREAVAIRLAGGPCPIPPDRVLVGAPIANGLSGTNAQVIAGNSLGRVQQYGPPIPINSNGINSPSGVTINSGFVGP